MKISEPQGSEIHLYFSRSENYHSAKPIIILPEADFHSSAARLISLIPVTLHKFSPSILCNTTKAKNFPKSCDIWVSNCFLLSERGT